MSGLEVALKNGFLKVFCSAQRKEKLKKDLLQAGIDSSVDSFVSAVILVAVLVSLFVSSVVSLWLSIVFFPVVFSLLFFAVYFFGLSFYPNRLKKIRGKKIESELPLLLRTMAIEINVNLPFEKVLENAANPSFGEAGKEMGIVLLDIRVAGASVQSALNGFGERVDSVYLKRCVRHMISVYEQGKPDEGTAGEPLKAVAQEQLSKQKSEMTEYNGRLVVFSLVFIAVSAIVPALFQAFIIVGSNFLYLSFTPMQALLIPAVVFPLIDLGVLCFIRSKTPVFMK
ncbi:MAG: type II secretion system F family protein [Candidatus Diapherotrites archaeon]|nr:type II secretion system F family protein [Candidatus Diapherotrites archaeon]